MAENECHIEEGLISVIMSNYNTHERYLKEAIDSILSQTYDHFEFIIVDDGSTDGSLKTIQSYTDPRIKLILNEENIGLARSLNKALDACRGEFVARMDSDDISYPQRFERQIAYMRERSDMIVCGTQITLLDQDSNLTGDYWETRSLDDMEEYQIHLLFANHPVIIHPSVMFNRRLLLKHHIRYNENYRYAQDYRMWVSCSRCGYCCTMPEDLLKYRIHPNAISTEKKHLQQECDFRIVQEQLDPLHLKLTKEIWPFHFRFLMGYVKPYDKRLKKWLIAMTKANKKYHVYNHTKLKKMIWKRWAKVCLFHFFRIKEGSKIDQLWDNRKRKSTGE